MVVYEVNLNLVEGVEEPFKVWLKDHIQEMESVEGIQEGTLVFEDSQNPLCLSVQYQFASMGAFHRCEAGVAKEMRSKLPENLRRGVQISRRVLKPLVF